MAKAPSIPLFNKEDLTADPDGFINNLNQAFDDIRLALENGITIRENMAAQIDDITVYISDDAPPYPFGFDWKYKNLQPSGCICVYADSKDGVESIFSAPQPRWYYSTGRIVVLGMRGNMQADKYYNLRFYTFAG